MKYNIVLKHIANNLKLELKWEWERERERKKENAIWKRKWHRLFLHSYCMPYNFESRNSRLETLDSWNDWNNVKRFPSLTLSRFVLVYFILPAMNSVFSSQIHLLASVEWWTTFLNWIASFAAWLSCFVFFIIRIPNFVCKRMRFERSNSYRE